MDNTFNCTIKEFETKGKLDSFLKLNKDLFRFIGKSIAKNKNGSYRLAY